MADARWLDAMGTLRGLGLLSPMFSGNALWDLRDAIFEVAQGPGKANGNRDMLMYVMLKVALLPEANVATFFEVEPSVVYARAAAYERSQEIDESLRNRTHRFVEEVIDRLRSD
jgi:hypothetical protein